MLVNSLISFKGALKYLQLLSVITWVDIITIGLKFLGILIQVPEFNGFFVLFIFGYFLIYDQISNVSEQEKKKANKWDSSYLSKIYI